MLTHEKIWAAIDQLASISGYSTSGLAKKAGLDPTTFNKSKRAGPDGKPRWPSTESLSLILAATGANLSDLLALVENEAGHITNSAPACLIPVIGTAQAGKNGFFDDAGYPVGEGWDVIQFPHQEKDGLRVYALEISGESMEPLYRKGDRLIVAPGAPIRKGDRVVLRTVRGEVMAKEVARQTANRLDLKSLNPHHEDRSFLLAEISWVARIVWVSQ